MGQAQHPRGKGEIRILLASLVATIPTLFSPVGPGMTASPGCNGKNEPSKVGLFHRMVERIPRRGAYHLEIQTRDRAGYLRGHIVIVVVIRDIALFQEKRMFAFLHGHICF